MREYYVDEGKLIVVDVCGRVCWPVRASAPCTRVYRPILMIVPGVAILNGAVRLTSLAAGCGLNRRYLRRAVTFPLPPKHYNYLLLNIATRDIGLHEKRLKRLYIYVP